MEIAITHDDYVALALVYAIIVVSLVVYLAVNKTKLNFDKRKIVHIGVGNFVFVWWMFSANWIMLVFFTIPFAILLFFAMLKDNVISKSALGEISRNGHKTGLFLYVVSINILVALCFDNWVAASIGIVAMTYGDGCGSLVGRFCGKHKTFNKKSVEGSFAVFAMTAIMAFVIITYYTFLVTNGYFPRGDVTTIVPVWAVCIVAGVVSSIAEMVSPGAYDNIIIPMTVTLSMVALGL